MPIPPPRQNDSKSALREIRTLTGKAHTALNRACLPVSASGLKLRRLYQKNPKLSKKEYPHPEVGEKD